MGSASIEAPQCGHSRRPKGHANAINGAATAAHTMVTKTTLMTASVIPLPDVLGGTPPHVSATALV